MGRSGAMVSGLLLPLLACLVGCQEDGRSAPLFSSTTTPVTSPSTAPIGSPQVLASGAFSALTYNVEGVPRTVTLSSLHPCMQQISPKLNSYDIVLVQEDFVLHDTLKQDAQHPFQSQPLLQFSSIVGDGLNRFSNLPFFDFSRTRWLDRYGLNDNFASKGFSVARHEVAPGVTVDVYNHHADAGGDARDIAARDSQFDQLERFLLTFSANQAVIIAGDTNLHASVPGDEQVLRDFLAGTGLRDVARTLGEPERIDRFLFRDGSNVLLKPVRWRIATEFVDAAGKPLSDHKAVHVDFEWRLVP